jgi:hypothetical protein
MQFIQSEVFFYRKFAYPVRGDGFGRRYFFGRYLEWTTIDRSSGRKKYHPSNLGLTRKVEKRERGQKIFLDVARNIQICRIRNRRVNEMESDVCPLQGVSDCCAICEVALPEFHRGECLAEEAAMAECENAVPRSGKTTAEVYAKEASAAQHDAETPSRLHTSFVLGANGAPSNI